MKKFLVMLSLAAVFVGAAARSVTAQSAEGLLMYDFDEEFKTYRVETVFYDDGAVRLAVAKAVFPDEPVYWMSATCRLDRPYRLNRASFTIDNRLSRLEAAQVREGPSETSGVIEELIFFPDLKTLRGLADSRTTHILLEGDNRIGVTLNEPQRSYLRRFIEQQFDLTLGGP